MWGATGLFGLLLILAAPGLWAGEIFASRDAGRLYLPLRRWLVDRLSSGELPLWLPHEALGAPVIESAVTAVFHPLTWLSVALGPELGGGVSTFLCLGLTLGGTWRLAAQLGADPWGRALAATTLTFSGAFLSTIDNQPYLWGFAAIPWFFEAALRTQRGALSRPLSLQLAGALAWALLAGEIQSAYLMALGGALLALWTRAPAPLLRVGGAGLLGAALAAPQIFPIFAALPQLQRGAGLPWENASAWSTHPLRLPELFLGDLLVYDPADPMSQAFSALGLEGRAPWSLTVFLGASALVAGSWALVLGGPGRRERRWLGGLALLAGLLALGRHAGIYRALYELLPLWSSFRYPEKLLPHLSLLLSLLAALGLSAARARPAQGARIATWLGAGLLGLALSSALLTLEAPLEAWGARLSTGAGIAGALSLLCGLALGRGRGGLLGPTLLAATLLQLSPQAARLFELFTVPAALTELESPFAAPLKAAGASGPGAPRIHTLARAPLGVSPPEGFPPERWGFSGRYAWERAALEPAHALDHGLLSSSHYLPAVNPRYRQLSAADDLAWASALGPVFGVRYVLWDLPSFRPDQAPGHQVFASRPDLGVIVTELEGALPRLYLARPIPLRANEPLRAQLLSPEVRGGHAVLLEGLSLPARPEPGPPPQGTISLLSEGPEHLSLRIEIAQPGAIVINDAYWPGWEATLNDRPQTIYRANGLVRAVPLPSGAHTLRLSLAPGLGLRLGLVVGAMALLTASFLAFWPLLPRRRRPSAG